MIRNPIKRSAWRSTYKLVTEKSPRGVLYCESWFEALHARNLIVRHDVLRIREQPFQVMYRRDEKPAIPDFLVELINEETEVHEVKPKEKADDPENRRRFEEIRHALAGQDLKYEVKTEVDIMAEPMFGNVELLFEHRRKPVCADDFARALEIISRYSGAAPLGTFDDAASYPAGRQTLFALVVRGQLFLDLWQPIGPTSLVRVSPSRN